LTALTTRWDKVFSPEKRVQPVHFTRELEVVEEFEVAAPPGYALELAPPLLEVSTPLFTASLEVLATPTGARVTRRMKHSIGGVGAEDYPRLQQVAETFREARAKVLLFAKKPAP
jgi:hypothetical protein